MYNQFQQINVRIFFLNNVTIGTGDFFVILDIEHYIYNTM